MNRFWKLIMLCTLAGMMLIPSPGNSDEPLSGIIHFTSKGK